MKQLIRSELQLARTQALYVQFSTQNKAAICITEFGAYFVMAVFQCYFSRCYCLTQEKINKISNTIIGVQAHLLGDRNQ
ncbi:hypothetical protein C7460_12179 [Marinoscillum furvescens DSM 4134]|uniref:Uncharacterized protein n=1 Tax=Marinoscillum furvescens DSM 4134 TaxID=1122208 RepID=A0A3D9KZE2_MARFU|nr:hypothetical protein C7460_12179 [Marinoscillum furvescens DSM 4134]